MNVAEQIEQARSVIATKQEELRALLKQTGEEFFANGLKAFWEAYPQVRTIHWDQYTPYFNDGEPCEFGVNEIMFSDKEHGDLNGTWGDDGEETIKLTEYYQEPIEGTDRMRYISRTAPGVTDQMVEDFEAVSGMIQQLDLEALFGDHAYVQVHRGGVEVSEVDHD